MCKLLSSYFDRHDAAPPLSFSTAGSCINAETLIWLQIEGSFILDPRAPNAVIEAPVALTAALGAKYTAARLLRSSDANSYTKKK